MNSYLESVLTDRVSSPLIYRFCFMGKGESKIKYFQELSELAETEKWHSDQENKNYDILINYITYTFDKAAKDDLVLFSDDKKYAAFNTGLLTENGEDIICMFNEFASSDDFSYHMMGFRKESDICFCENFSETPKVVTYFSDPERIYFNPNLSLVKNLDHILDDNFDRFPSELKAKGKLYILALLESSLNLTIKRCKRNYRIAVPQYYNDEITYLLPINLDGHKMALAVKAVKGRYRVNTIFTLTMAYKNARLLMKPESDWLTI